MSNHVTQTGNQAVSVSEAAQARHASKDDRRSRAVQNSSSATVHVARFSDGVKVTLQLLDNSCSVQVIAARLVHMDDLVPRNQRALARVRKASNELDKTLRSIGVRPVRKPVKRRARQRD